MIYNIRLCRSYTLNLGYDKFGIMAIGSPVIYDAMFFGRVTFMDMYLDIFIITTLLKVRSDVAISFNSQLSWMSL